MRTVLVGVDGSPTSLTALSWGAHLAAAFGAKVVAASALEVALEGVEPELAEQVLREQRERIEQWCRDAGVDSAVRPAVLEGSAGPALARAVSVEAADLLVVGTEGTRGRFGPRLGSVANYLAHHVQVPLLTVPFDRPWRKLSRILIGVDGSVPSSAAVELVARLAKAEQVAVSAVYVHQPVAEWVLRQDPRSWFQQATVDLGQWTSPLDASGGAVDRKVCAESHTAATLLGEAASAGADLLVVGAHPITPIARVRAGGTTFQLLYSARIPTLLVPPAAADGGGEAGSDA